jgi:haloacetate dehalogenase
MFEGFDSVDIETPRGSVRARVGGSGPPLLLVHGWPETHLMWHSVAPLLAERFTVVAPDLPGYGDSFRPPVREDHFPHSKRAFAADLVAALGELGHRSFAVVGHDRGGRVAYRMALDHPDAVTRLAVLDIVPTGEVWARVDATLMLGYWHWAFLAQPAPLAERLINGDPDAFWLAAERIGLKPGDPRFPEPVLAAYRAQLDDPAFVTASCEDYRAGATIDREHDLQGGTIACPVLSLWGGAGGLPRFYADPLEPWRTFAPGVTGRAIEGASHFLVEDAPGEVAAELTAFLT